MKRLIIAFTLFGLAGCSAYPSDHRVTVYEKNEFRIILDPGRHARDEVWPMAQKHCSQFSQTAELHSVEGGLYQYNCVVLLGS